MYDDDRYCDPQQVVNRENSKILNSLISWYRGVSSLPRQHGVIIRLVFKNLRVHRFGIMLRLQPPPSNDDLERCAHEREGWQN